MTATQADRSALDRLVAHALVGAVAGILLKRLFTVHLLVGAVLVIAVHEGLDAPVARYLDTR